jgi:hypothetical protein
MHVDPEDLEAHGRVWRDEGDILTTQANIVRYSANTRLNWGQLITCQKKEYDYIRLLFPIRFIHDVMIPITSQSLNSHRQAEINYSEFITFLGITLAMALQPIRGGVDAYWCVQKSMDGTIYLPGNYGERFNMSRQRLKLIRKHFRCAPLPEVVPYVLDVPVAAVEDLTLGAQ